MRQTRWPAEDDRGHDRPLRFVSAAATMRRMPVGDLLGLETAMRDVAHLYESALIFTALRRRAEDELLPQLTTLGADLRGQVRDGGLATTDVEAAARHLHRLRDEWHDTLDAVRGGAPYRAAVAAVARDDQRVLPRLIPEVFAGVTAAERTPVPLFHPVSPAGPGRRRPFGRPFLSPEACAEKLDAYRRGVAPEPAGTQWWEQDLPTLPLVDRLSALDSPIALAFDLKGGDIAVFQGELDLAFRLYTARLIAPFTVVLARIANDEWWEAFEGSYPAFRDRLVEVLVAGGFDVRLVESEEA